MARFAAEIWLRCQDRIFVVNWSPLTIISSFVTKTSHLRIKVELVHVGATQNGRWLDIMEELLSFLTSLLLALSINQWTFSVIANLLLDQLLIV